MIVTNVGRVAVDAGSADNERRESVRQKRVVLTPRCWRRRWQECMAHRGEYAISRKAIAQGMSDCLRCPVCSCAQPTTLLRTGPRVQRASGIPCALCLKRAKNFMQTSGATRRENATVCLLVGNQFSSSFRDAPLGAGLRCAIAHRGMTEKTPSPSRDALRPSCASNFPPPSNQRAQGMPDARCTRGLMRNV